MISRHCNIIIQGKLGEIFENNFFKMIIITTELFMYIICYCKKIMYYGIKLRFLRQ